MRLLKHTLARDTSALVEAFEPRYEDGFEWWGGGPGETLGEYMEGLREDVVVDEPAVFGMEDVRLRSWSGGRVWQLYRDRADGLLQSEALGAYWDVFVGLNAEGGLRVVR